MRVIEPFEVGSEVVGRISGSRSDVAAGSLVLAEAFGVAAIGLRFGVFEAGGHLL